MAAAQKLEGIIASPGIAIGEVVFYHNEYPEIPEADIARDQIDDEIGHFMAARQNSMDQLEKIYKETCSTLGEQQASVFEGHMLIAEDEELEEEVLELIRSGKNAVAAADQVIRNNIGVIEQLENEYLRERAADLRDVGVRMVCNILGIPMPGLGCLKENSIIVANDLSPSDTAQLDFTRVKGFVTAVGGKTSHSAILARTLELPAIVGCTEISAAVKDGDTLILDALNNNLIPNPNAEQLEQAGLELDKLETEKQELRLLKDLPAQTSDGCLFEMGANIGQPGDIELAMENGAEGIGLFRTEFLFMGRSSMPSEEVQFEAYRRAAEAANGMSVIIRTLDIGGDKNLPYLDLPAELNPFLGWRAIRMCLDRPEILHTQLRAILRASAFGKIKILFPMVISLDEVQRLKAHIELVTLALTEEGVAYDQDCEVGVMVETPASVMIADQLIKEVDFFSIGTNDLTQYLLAVDRGNENISGLYDSLSPSVLRAIKMVIDAAHNAGKWVGMCGELAGDEQAALVLAGMGLDEFSMPASSIPRVKKALRKANTPTLKHLAEKCLELRSSDEVKALVDAVASV
ncbi:phosphoenolpyruvate--protein phosphotransferase [Sansalvadorimonas sp. 2012CJ34-2]|uniref:Phosphoenolpyruvate-protein phosphotransferase n=1 Tax=Parendozoicomonas callyspongiae TaxID=2942213 RepID=A0ABT0PD17_9GAMM|nr:phosphoenolpyruvate--protein phosphotransferase [Sansalvadorimonas sp. 2012CJ34-2]MCL6268931.1 phosphoenolpyruvate--protein phosphotransferase [Sansalvadorimonas sp. 2012CJ34-2]